MFNVTKEINKKENDCSFQETQPQFNDMTNIDNDNEDFTLDTNNKLSNTYNCSNMLSPQITVQHSNDSHIEDDSQIDQNDLNIIFYNDSKYLENCQQNFISSPSHNSSVLEVSGVFGDDDEKSAILTTVITTTSSSNSNLPQSLFQSTNTTSAAIKNGNEKNQSQNNDSKTMKIINKIQFCDNEEINDDDEDEDHENNDNASTNSDSTDHDDNYNDDDENDNSNDDNNMKVKIISKIASPSLPDDSRDNENTFTDTENDNDDESDDDDDDGNSEFSDLSGLSDISGQEWKPISSKPITWVQKQIHLGANPREILSQIISNGTKSPSSIAPNLSNMTLWKILASILSEPPRRQKLRHVNTIEDVVRLLEQSKNIIVLTGAGVSVSCGIPDFRSNNGIYNRLAKDFPDLPDPQAMFDINYFSKDPRPFYKFAREIYPGQFKPSPCHRFIKLLENKQKLLRNYTQNIDTLEQIAGISNVIECHGSFATASCTKCKHKTTADVIRDDIFAQKIPLCPKCQPNVNSMNSAFDPLNNSSSLSPSSYFSLSNGVSEKSIKYHDLSYLTTTTNEVLSSSPPSSESATMIPSLSSVQSYSEIVQNGIMKPDIVFFGEGLPDAFHTAMASDKDKCDLLIVIGSSLKVRPVALIPSSIPPDVPQILINRERLNHLEFDVELLGDSDVIINHLCHLLGRDWEEEICWDPNLLTESTDLKPKFEYDKPSTLVKEDSTTIQVKTPSSIDNDSKLQQQQQKLIVTTNPCNLIDDDVSYNFKCTTNTDGSNSPCFDSGFENSTSSSSQQQQLQRHKENQQESSIIETECSNNKLMNLFSKDIGRKSNSTDNNDEIKSHFPQRHLSIDSCKDSGIGGDSSSNNLLSSIQSCKTNLSNINEISDNDNDDDHCKFLENKNIKTSSKNVMSSAFTSTSSSLSPSGEQSSSILSLSKSIAERLHENTYYHHPLSSSYVFPGAQVFLTSDSENDDEDDIEFGKHNTIDKNKKYPMENDRSKSENDDNNDEKLHKLKSNENEINSKKRLIDGNQCRDNNSLSINFDNCCDSPQSKKRKQE